MGTEYHHGSGGGDHVPPGRTLNSRHGRPSSRIAIALVLLVAFVANWAVPLAATATPADPPTDPRVIALIKNSCGGGPTTAQKKAEIAAVRAMLADAMPVVGTPPPGAKLADPPPQFKGRLLAQAATPTPSPAPQSSSTPAPSDTSTGGEPGTSSSPVGAPEQTAAPDQAPSPSPSATLRIPGVPPPGPVELVPPTPQPSSSVMTPPPLPTASANPTDTGPVFIVRPSGTPTPIPIKGSSPEPGGIPTATGPTPIATLGPNQIVTVADKLIGSSNERDPSDLIGNVHIFYTEGQIVGDRAHYDGGHTITVMGHTYLVNRAQDSILYADKIVFDTHTRRATLLQGVGESIEGVQQGKLHFKADTLETKTDGVTHGEHAYFTTCENPHAGYHVEARQIDVTPGDKLVAHKATVFLGPTAILYLPLLVIPLLEVVDPRRQASFLPLIGYDSAEGFWIKLKIGFGTSNQYYGYYRVEYYTKRGLGLGYTAYLGAKDGHRYTTIDSYTISDHTQDARLTNFTINDVETFSKRLRGQFGVQYQGDFGPNLPIPPSIDISGSIIHQTGSISTENLEFQRQMQGTISDTFSLGFIDSLTLSQYIQQQIALTYSRFLGSGQASDTFHVETNTHISTKGADYNLVYDKTDYSSNPFGYDRVPELQILPHISYGGFKYAPQIQVTIGEYAEPENHFSTSRFQGQLAEAFYAKVFGNSDFSANYNITQDYYGTGDEKAFDQQSASLNTPIGQHLINSVNYNEQHPIGPPNVPFQLFDNLSPGSHSAQDTLRYYNKDVYSFSLSDGTNFDRQAQSISYQLNYRPSLKSYLIIGGYYQPGSGSGFGPSNVQAITPFGRDTELEFITNIDWHNHNRLEDKSIILSRTVDNCYNMQFTYNQDLKVFSFNIVILAFPGQGAGFGIGGNTGGGLGSIVPQSLNF
jgi:hypothetical protein